MLTSLVDVDIPCRASTSGKLNLAESIDMQSSALAASGTASKVVWREAPVREENRLLIALSTEARARLSSCWQPVYLRSGKQIYDCDDPTPYLYFPTTATISVQSLLEDGLAVEVGIIGREGVLGLSTILGSNRAVNRAVVQSSGKCLKVRADWIQHEFARGGNFQRQTLLYTNALIKMISQTSACSRRHSVKQRFSRWLLSVLDRVNTDELPLTQDFISQLLGSRRASITGAANDLQRANAICYSRGNIQILNRFRLQETACECYMLIKEEFDRFLNPKHPLFSR
jgi:CRP-like cAMP-binding protein